MVGDVHFFCGYGSCLGLIPNFLPQVGLFTTLMGHFWPPKWSPLFRKGGLCGGEGSLLMEYRFVLGVDYEFLPIDWSFYPPTGSFPTPLLRHFATPRLVPLDVGSPHNPHFPALTRLCALLGFAAPKWFRVFCPSFVCVSTLWPARFDRFGRHGTWICYHSRAWYQGGDETGPI